MRLEPLSVAGSDATPLWNARDCRGSDVARQILAREIHLFRLCNIRIIRTIGIEPPVMALTRSRQDIGCWREIST